jgi:methylmalonyl-CoA mutase
MRTKRLWIKVGRKQVLFEIYFEITREMSEKFCDPHRTRYLSEIAESNRKYDETALSQQQVAQKIYGIFKTIESVSGNVPAITKVGIDDTTVYPCN